MGKIEQVGNLTDQVLGIVYRFISMHLVKKAGYSKKTARTGAVTLIRKCLYWAPSGRLGDPLRMAAVEKIRDTFLVVSELLIAEGYYFTELPESEPSRMNSITEEFFLVLQWGGGGAEIRNNRHSNLVAGRPRSTQLGHSERTRVSLLISLVGPIIWSEHVRIQRCMIID